MYCFGRLDVQIFRRLNIFGTYGKKLCRLSNPLNFLEELRHQLQMAWDELPQEEINRLISSLP
ncbi:hypothetical protein BDFB_013562 [Asbolus verrucosus]|uniref:DDE 3 domain containing protein n=1 Tax=Asbolus verrucosus TaxID=1661398 RepID=A0A482V9A4_ASBVE|nr:hypothetical protein BDFB_013562 [Asbolus verrucosus]